MIYEYENVDFTVMTHIIKIDFLAYRKLKNRFSDGKRYCIIRTILFGRD